MNDEQYGLFCVLILFLTIVIFFLMYFYIYTKCKRMNINYENNNLYIFENLEYDDLEINLNAINNKIECCICLEIMDNNIYETKCCKKYVHKKCIVNYILYHKKNNNNNILCPYCRSNKL